MPRDWDGAFDRVVSIEMVEAVGLENMDAYWAAIDRVLKRKNAAGVIQGITIPEARQSRRDHVILFPTSRTRTGFADYSKQMDFIQKWVSSLFHSGAGV